MTRLQILSDIHVEFHADAGRDFIRRLDPTGVDVLVVAGDLATMASLRDALARLCDRYPQVVFVLGNHEYYGSSPSAIHEEMARAASLLPNLHWLHNTKATIGGIRFAGTPLWFRPSLATRKYQNQLNDFALIRDFTPWVYEENTRALAFLRKAQDVDVVVTHHLPSKRSVAPRYVGSSLNCYFVCDVEAEMKALAPSLWVHGHTHDSADYRLGTTRVLCNPYGYAEHDRNRDFIKKLVVDAEGRHR